MFLSSTGCSGDFDCEELSGVFSCDFIALDGFGDSCMPSSVSSIFSSSPGTTEGTVGGKSTKGSLVKFGTLSDINLAEKQFRDRRQILFPVLSEFKRINELLLPLRP